MPRPATPIAACLLAFVSSIAPTFADQTPRPLRLAEAFGGQSLAVGTFSSPVAGVSRSFRARLNGRASGDTLTVVETFRFADGKRDRKTWRFIKVGPGRWSGTREDVIGTADVVEADGQITLDYVATVDTGAGAVPLAFSDVIYRGGAGRLINKAVVSSLGIPVATVALDIRR